MDSGAGYVQLAKHGAVATIEFFHPQGNSLPRILLDRLAAEIQLVGADHDIKVIILQSGGDRAFCGGASFEELATLHTASEGKHFFEGFVHVILAMRKCPKFILAKIHGRCIGGGVGLAAAADYSFATSAAEIRLSELAIGLGPFVIGPVVQRKIGLAAFSQLAIDAASWMTASWAKSHGLFAEIHDGKESLDEAIQRLAGQLCHYNPEAMLEMKQMFWEGTSDWEQLLSHRAAISGRLAISEFTKAAIAQFRQGKKQDR